MNEYQFEWWHIPIYILVFVVGAWLRDKIYNNLRK